MYFAGGILGIVIVLAVLGVVGVAGSDLGVFGWIIVLAGAVLGGLLREAAGRSGDRVRYSAGGRLPGGSGPCKPVRPGVESGNPLRMLGTLFPLVLFASIALISGLSQYEAMRVRQRFLH